MNNVKTSELGETLQTTGPPKSHAFFGRRTFRRDTAGATPANNPLLTAV